MNTYFNEFAMCRAKGIAVESEDVHCYQPKPKGQDSEYLGKGYLCSKFNKQCSAKNCPFVTLEEIKPKDKKTK